MTTQSGTNRCA